MKTYPNVSETENNAGIRWGELTALEPVLGELLCLARQAGVGCRRRSDVDRVFAPIRNALSDLIGFSGKHHRHPLLGSTAAYQVAYWKLYDAVAGLLSDSVGGPKKPADQQSADFVADTFAAEWAAAALARG
jgi:hypothetical protein